MCIRGRALLCCGLWVTSLKGMVGGLFTICIPPLGTQAHKKHENAQAIVSFCAGIRCPSSRAENRRVLCVPKMPQHKMSHDHSQPCATGAGGAGAVACSSVDDTTTCPRTKSGAIENAPGFRRICYKLNTPSSLGLTRPSRGRICESTTTTHVIFHA